MTMAELNDYTRTVALMQALKGEVHPGHVLVMTCGVAALPARDVLALMLLVMEYSDFNDNIDPHHEHDMGRIRFGDESYYWKIDYFDARMEFGSPDPLDPAVTTRVLTVMNVDEY